MGEFLHRYLVCYRGSNEEGRDAIGFKSLLFRSKYPSNRELNATVVLIESSEDLKYKKNSVVFTSMTYLGQQYGNVPDV